SLQPGLIYGQPRTGFHVGSVHSIKQLTDIAYLDSLSGKFIENIRHNVLCCTFMRGEEQVANDRPFAVAHRQWLGNSCESGDCLKPLTKSLGQATIRNFSSIVSKRPCDFSY